MKLFTLTAGLLLATTAFAGQVEAKSFNQLSAEGHCNGRVQQGEIHTQFEYDNCVRGHMDLIGGSNTQPMDALFDELQSGFGQLLNQY